MLTKSFVETSIVVGSSHSEPQISVSVDAKFPGIQEQLVYRGD